MSNYPINEEIKICQYHLHDCALMTECLPNIYQYLLKQKFHFLYLFNHAFFGFHMKLVSVFEQTYMR